MDIFKKEETQSKVLVLENISKANLKSMADSIIDNVMEGNSDALKEYIKAKGIIEIANTIVDGLKEMAIRESYKYLVGEKVLGCEIQTKSTATTYSFDHDEEWSVRNNTIEQLKEQQKLREKQMLDAINYSQVVNDDGEVVHPAILKKQGSTTIAILIPKK